MVMTRLAASTAIYLRHHRMFGWFVVPSALVFLAPALIATRDIALGPGDAGVIALAVLVCLLVAVVTMMWNDICDQAVDEVIHPERPIASGECDPRDVLVSSAILLVLSLAAAAWISPLFLLICAVHYAVSALHYGLTKKRLRFAGASELLTSLQNALIVPAGWAVGVALGADPTGADLVAIVALSGLMYLGDVASDAASAVADLPGDTLNGVATFASIRGEPAAARAALLFGLGAALAGSAGLAALEVSLWTWVAWIALAGWAAFAFIAFDRSASFERALMGYRAGTWISNGLIILLGVWAGLDRLP
jgi:4-hydroxybenzoate polyprenyltransferase